MSYDTTEEEDGLSIKYEVKSVKSINPIKSVIQTTYDIIKAHGGEIRVESKEGEGSVFIIVVAFSN
jgi:hypothetical protein